MTILLYVMSQPQSDHRHHHYQRNILKYRTWQYFAWTILLLCVRTESSCVVDWSRAALHYSIWEWTFHSKINTQDSGFLCTSLKKFLCYIYTRYAPARFILLWLIRWRAFFVSFRHFSKCCTLLCLSCRPGKKKGREKHLKVEKWGQFTKRSNTKLQQSHNYHTQNILNKKKKLTISIQIDSTLKKVLLRWAK